MAAQPLAGTTERGPVARTTADAIVPYLIALVYVAAQIALYSVHEPWRDEGQAWLKAMDLAGWQYLVIPSEGHPPVWYWLLRLLQLAFTFDQARLLMLGVAALNAWLLARLLGDRPALLIALMGSLAVLHSWGFHFRPYPLILTCVVGALLLDRSGRQRAATWLLVLACGLSFFGGWLLGLWLMVLLRRGTPLRQLIAPALVASAFGVSAVLSSLGNHDGGLDLASVPLGILNGLAYPFSLPLMPVLPNVVIILGLLGYGLRRSPFILASLAALLFALALFGALIYGLSEWHAAFGIMLALMAFTLARAPAWPLALLLLPQVYFGFEKAMFDIRLPASADGIAYAAVVADAGSRLNPSTNLVAWPDYVLTPTAAQFDYRYISGNNGAVVGAIDWSARKHQQIDANLLRTLDGPYWLVCSKCDRPLIYIERAGRKVTNILPLTYSMTDPLTAYRID